MADNLAPGQAEKRPDFAEFAMALVAGLALAVITIFLVLLVAGKLPGSRDFVSYWATGRQLVEHGNPYDRETVAELEHAAGLNAQAVLIMRNPPWALPLVYPLGFLPLRVAAAAWTFLLLACLLISLYVARELYGSPPNRIHWLAWAFTPALLCLTMGQTSLFALLGLVLFLRLHERRPFAAGAALWLCALKPHLFLPFAAALAAWIVVSRGYKLVAGTAAALAVSSAAAFLIDPHAWRDYIGLMRSPSVANEFIPCLASAIRQWVAPQATWVQYAPALVACVWALIYYWRRRGRWNWITCGSPLMLVSLVAAPYCWLYDQGLAIPALLDGAYATRSRILLTVLAMAILTMDIEIGMVQVISPLWLWTAPAWLVWYVAARGRGRVHTSQLEVR